MCVSCDCGEHADGHEDPRHITLEMLQAAAEAAETTIDAVAHNIVNAVHARESH